MSPKFTTRTPKPRKPTVEPLKEFPAEAAAKPATADKPAEKSAEKSKEVGGPSGPEPTRYGDWERKGICVDF
jgi:hypothetical protein